MPYQSLAETFEGAFVLLSWSKSLDVSDTVIEQEEIEPDHSIIKILTDYEADKKLAEAFFQAFPEALKFHRNMRGKIKPDKPLRKIDTDDLLLRYDELLDEHKEEISAWLAEHEAHNVYTSFSKHPETGDIFPHGRKRKPKKRDGFDHVNIVESFCQNSPSIVKIITYSREKSTYEAQVLATLGELKLPFFSRNNYRGETKYYLLLDDLGENLHQFIRYYLEEKNNSVNNRDYKELNLTRDAFFKIFLEIIYLYIRLHKGESSHNNQGVIHRDSKLDNVVFNCRRKQFSVIDYEYATIPSIKKPLEIKDITINLVPPVSSSFTCREKEIISIQRMFLFEFAITNPRTGRLVKRPSISTLYEDFKGSERELSKLLSTRELFRWAYNNIYNVLDDETRQLQSNTVLELGAKIALLYADKTADISMLNFSGSVKQKAIVFLALASIDFTSVCWEEVIHNEVRPVSW